MSASVCLINRKKNNPFLMSSKQTGSFAELNNTIYTLFSGFEEVRSVTCGKIKEKSFV